MGEPIWVYDVKFAVNTKNTRETVKAFGKDMIPKLLQEKYPNCKITIHEIKEMGREK